METYLKRYDPRDPYWAPYKRFHESIGVEVLERVLAVERSSYEYVEVYAPSQALERLLEEINIDGLYSMGLYAGMMKPREWFKPSLPLAHKLAPLCGRIKCIILNSGGEKFFLYGKTVYGEGVESWSPGLSLVTNTRGEALGWGVGKIINIVGGGQRRVVEPLWDMGWYLRRGG